MKIMNRKIQVALVYRPCQTLSKNNYYTHVNNFFMYALKRNEQISITYYPTKEVFNIKDVKSNTDIILLPENGNDSQGDICMPDQIKNIDHVDIPVLSRIGDTHTNQKKDVEKNHTKYNITAYFNYQPEQLFRKYFGQKFKFKTILWGVENPLYENIKPFNNRIKTRILNTGALAPKKFLSKMVTKYLRSGDSINQYKLRTMCNDLPYVDHTPTLQHEYVGDRYQELLEKYTVSLAATDYCYTTKYLEIPAAGCLTFMQVTDTNYAESLGFKDNESAIFINEKNYQSKFEEYVNDVDNKKWQEIASTGREYVMKNLTNDHAVNRLVDFMRELIGA